MHAEPAFRPTFSRTRRWAFAALALAAGGAHAASFDCKAAKSPTEHAICGSPKLSALDERLAREYERALHALSPAGATQLKASQRDWLRFASRVCTSPTAKKPEGSTADCLEPEYTARIGELAQAGIRIGPYVFNRIDFHTAYRAAADDDGGANAGFATDHVAFAQIDAPLTPAITAWNAAQRVEAPDPAAGDNAAPRAGDDPSSDDGTDFEIGCASERFVSLSLNKTWYEHGAAHGGYDHEVRNAMLAPALRKMAVGDIFAPNSGWKTRLPPLFYKAWTRDPEAAKEMPSIKDAILASAANPDRWLLTPEGLQISFDADEAGCYACNPGPITVPWSTLKPMLASPDLASCKGPPAKQP